MASEDFLKVIPIISLWELNVAIIHGNQSSNAISPKTLYSLCPTWWYSSWNLITVIQLTLEIYFFKNVNRQWRQMKRRMDEGRLSLAYLICTFGSGYLKRQLRRQRVPNPSIFLCLKQFRKLSNWFRMYPKVKKTDQAIFFSHHLIQTGKCKIPWHFPDILANIHFSLTHYEIPWQFPDLEKI